MENIRELAEEYKTKFENENTFEGLLYIEKSDLADAYENGYEDAYKHLVDILFPPTHDGQSVTDEPEKRIEKLLEVYSELLSAKMYDSESIASEVARMKQAILQD